MDKYEFNIKVEQIKKLVNKGDYETAMKIADSIDWKRVRNASLLSMIAQVYERNEEYQESKDILLLAFERAPIGKRLLYKLTELALKEGNIEEAEAYYREFCDLASDDSRQHLLRYMILNEKGAPADQLIHTLERYTSEELDEKWLYRLAELYQEAGNSEACVAICDKIMLLFGLGKYVDKAMELKIQFAPLTTYQMDLVENRDKYEAKLREVEQNFGSNKPSYQEEVSEEDYSDDESEDLQDQEDMLDPEPVIEEDAVVSFHEAEAEKSLAREMSKFSDEDMPEEDAFGETRIIGNIKEIKEFISDERLQPVAIEEEEMSSEELAAEETAVSDQWEDEEDIIEDLDLELEEDSNHLMIEAYDSQAGLELALESLKKIHKEQGTKAAVAKISGDKLNKKGIFAVMDKLSGKDLVIEGAAQLTQPVLAELNELMDKDATGMIVVLIDTPDRIEYLHNHNPGLASRFQCIGCKGPVISEEDLIIRELEATKSLEKQAAAQEEIAKGVLPVADPVKIEPQPVAPVVNRVQPAVREVVITEPVRQNPQPEAVNYSRQAKDAYEADDNTDESMDVEAFAQYACKYATEIDCSISGKSLLALYERIEMMDEDGVLLNRKSAEELIEEAADKAEKPSLGGRLKGILSAKYDKDGLLILKEEHFFD